MIQYAVIKIEELPKIDFSELLQDSADTCMTSINGEKKLVSFDKVPSFMMDVNWDPIFGRYFFTEDEVGNFPNVLPPEMLEEWDV